MQSNQNNNTTSNFFWPSYVDLMTSLFIVTLVLFVLSYSLSKKNEVKLQKMAKKHERVAKEYEIEANKFKKIKEIEQSLRALQGKYFAFDPQFKRHELKHHVQFAERSSLIPTQDIRPLQEAGKELERIIKKIREKNEKEKMEVSYLIVIEGSASTDNYLRNYELSYERALAVSRLWKNSGIELFNNQDDTYEVQISGTGTGGVGRYADKAGKNEKNQRILVQVIPKVGAFKV